MSWSTAMVQRDAASSATVAVIATIVFNWNTGIEANKPGVTDKISTMAMNGSGVRDTGRVLGISITTVITHLKNLPHLSSHHSH